MKKVVDAQIYGFSENFIRPFYLKMHGVNYIRNRKQLPYKVGYRILQHFVFHS
jgi:hypothetical protein